MLKITENNFVIIITITLKQLSHNSIIMTEEVEQPELKECQLCHQMLPKEQFYKRKDRNGNPNWTMSYCGSCDNIKVKESRGKKPVFLIF
jgi:hypothetical protein